MQQCANDMFGGQCTGTPEIVEARELEIRNPKDPNVITHLVVGKCKLNKKTCGHFTLFSEVIKEAPNLGSGITMKKVGEEGTVKHISRKKKKEPLGRQGALLP